MDPFGRCEGGQWEFQCSLHNVLGQLANAGQARMHRMEDGKCLNAPTCLGSIATAMSSRGNAAMARPRRSERPS